MIAAVVLMAALPSQTIAVSASKANPLLIHCPVGATTRIVFPEPVMASLSPGMQNKLGIGWEPGSRSRVALVRPSEHPSRAVLQFTGRQFGRFVIRLETVATGASREVNLTVPAPSAPAGARGISSPGGRVASQPSGGTAIPKQAPDPAASSGPPSSPPSQPRASGAIRSPRELSVQMSSGFVKLRNESTAPIAATRVILVGSDGRRFVAKDVSLTPAWEMRLAFDEFSPPIPEHVEIVRAELLDSSAARPPAEPVLAAPTKPTPAEKQAIDAPGQTPSLGAKATPQVSDAPVVGLLDREILRARLRPVGRVESMPGQREVELADILEGENYLWLRFNVRRGAQARVQEVSWEHGPIASFTTEVVNKGKDLLVVVQLPKARTTKRTRVTLQLDDGVRKFPLSAPWLSSLVKDILGF